MKWGFIPQNDGKPHYLVVNADEGEPGTCKDLPLMMADPHSLVEGVIIASYAIRANFAAIYIRGEAVHAARRLRDAVEQAYAKPGTSAQNILGTGFDLDLVVHSGAGAYICGEETALLDSLEGYRGQPRLRPPFPATHGLYACRRWSTTSRRSPACPYIVLGGSAWFAQHGHREVARPDDLLALRPGQPTPASTSAAWVSRCGELIELAGGMQPGHELKFWTPGGSSTPMLTDEHLDVPLDFEGMAGGGHDARHDRDADLLRPGRPGLRHVPVDRLLPPRVVRQVHPVPRGQLLDGADPTPHPRRPGHRTRTWTPCWTPATTSSAASFCALGDGATSPVTSSIKYFKQDYLDYIEGRKAPMLHEGEQLAGAALMTDVLPKARHGQELSPVDASPSTVEVAPKGALLIRAAEQIGIYIPRFCDHPLLAPAGACRQCLVDVEGQRKPVAPPARQTGRRRHGGPHPADLRVAKKAQEGIMEFLLINHPLDCPICDKGGECPLQNQAMCNGQSDTRFSSTSGVPEAAADLHPGAARPRAVRAVPALHPVLRRDRRRQVHRPDGALVRRADRHRPRAAVQLVLLRQHGADLPGRRADRRAVPVPGPAVRPGLHAERVRALRGRLRPAHRPPPRQGHAPPGRRRPGGQRGVELRQGPLGVPVRHRVRPADHAAGPRRADR